MRALHLKVHLLRPFWHGSPDWPPSPFRLFQAMVAGAFGGRWVAEDHSHKIAALLWLEQLDPPLIAAPPKLALRHITSYVPNNDLDSVGGDPRRVEEIRAEKVLAPLFLERDQGFSYAWFFDGDESHAAEVCRLAERLHTFGRGIDPAWVEGVIENPNQVESKMADLGPIARPNLTGQEARLQCPAPGSLESLQRRHQDMTARFTREKNSRRTLFRQPPKAHFRSISYDRKYARLEFTIRKIDDLNHFFPIVQRDVTALTKQIRDSAAARLVHASAKHADQASRFLTGKDAGPGDVTRRIQIVPLPTIGHPQASPSIRRLIVQIPPECPLPQADIEWAFEGVPVHSTGSSGGVLVRESIADMGTHYGFGKFFKTWRSVTPVALPRQPQVKVGSDRVRVEQGDTAAIVSALRHAGVSAKIDGVRIQREPFHSKGAMADEFVPDRFVERLRHVEITFCEPVEGPLIVGDGRFLGLGVMRPVRERGSGIYLFSIASPQLHLSRAGAICRCLRRAVMLRTQTLLTSRKELPPLVHGHEPDGSPRRSGKHEHLFYAAFSSRPGTALDRLAILLPNVCDKTVTAQNIGGLNEAFADLSTLKCGRDGILHLTSLPSQYDCRFFGSGSIWKSCTPYEPTRHPKSGVSSFEFIASDIRVECARRGFPTPTKVSVESIDDGPRGGLAAAVTIEFNKPLRGPILIGQNSHFGAGLFQT